MRFYRWIKCKVAYVKIVRNKALFFWIKIICVLAVMAGTAYAFIASNVFGDSQSILQTVIQVLTLGATILMLWQLVIMKDTSNMELSHQIYNADSDYRLNILNAKGQLERLVKEVESLEGQDGTALADLYNETDYKDIKSVAFHYEYIGQLVYRERLNFEVVFDTVTFPDTLFAELFQPKQSADSKKGFIVKMRSKTPDFWEGIEYLYWTYEVKRKYNRWNSQGQKPAERKERKRDLVSAKKAWKAIYKRMPA